MNIVENCVLDQERALYGRSDLIIKNVCFDGPADGESAVKECRNIEVEGCYCNLRYPFWHVDELSITDTTMTDKCRAALWYSDAIHISASRLHGIKALRECSDVVIEGCDIISPEFGWSTRGITMRDTSVTGEYFMMRSDNIYFDQVRLKGKYSFQYIQDAIFENCNLDTKDAFWHGQNIVVRNSIVKGEYLAWYADGLTLENCTIIGTQPFCYCRNLKLINCRMIDTDLCFEKSQVDATITTPVISIKNPYDGTIEVPQVGEIIRDDPRSNGVIVLTDAQ